MTRREANKLLSYYCPFIVEKAEEILEESLGSIETVVNTGIGIEIDDVLPEEE